MKIAISFTEKYKRLVLQIKMYSVSEIFHMITFFKVKRLREKSIYTIEIQRLPIPTSEQNSAFLNHFNALRQPRNMKTRRLAQAEDNPEFTKTAILANLLSDMFNMVTEIKGLCEFHL